MLLIFLCLLLLKIKKHIDFRDYDQPAKRFDHEPKLRALGYVLKKDPIGAGESEKRRVHGDGRVLARGMPQIARKSFEQPYSERSARPPSTAAKTTRGRRARRGTSASACPRWQKGLTCMLEDIGLRSGALPSVPFFFFSLSLENFIIINLGKE